MPRYQLSVAVILTLAGIATATPQFDERQSRCTDKERCVPIVGCAQYKTREDIFARAPTVCGFQDTQSLVCCQADQPGEAPPSSAEAGITPTERPELAAETSNLATTGTRPTTKSPTPATERPKPTAKSPTPATDRPKPAAKSPTPATERPKPIAKSPTPAIERPKPAAKSPTPATERPKPTAKSPTSTTDRPKPAAKSPTPATERKPAAKSPTPATERKPAAKSPTPATEPSEPAGEQQSQPPADCGRSAPSSPAEILCHLLPESEACLAVARTAPGSWPWLALFGLRSGDSLADWFCGGALISVRYVLTAAHCMLPHEPSALGVRLGNVRLSDEGDLTHQLRGVTAVVPHPRHRDGERDDLALVRLDRPAQLTAAVRLVCLPPPRADIAAGSLVTMVGYGVQFRGPFPDPVLSATLEVVDTDACVQAHNRVPPRQRRFPTGFRGTKLCARATKQSQVERELCPAERGGPIMNARITDTTTFYELVAVVSFAVDCTDPDLPQVYTKVSYYVEWILDTIK